MPDLIGKIRRGLRKPPSYIAARLLHEAGAATERYRAPARARALTTPALCRALAAGSIDEIWARCAARPFPFFPKDAATDTLERLCPGETSRIGREADDALARRVDLLGSGMVALGTPTDWSRDFKVGWRWPDAFFRDIEYSNLGEPSDVKVPWELSRLQWLIPLAQRYVLARDERDAAGVRAVLEEWIGANPYAWTINWTCTMEAALRILVFAWLFHALKDSAAFADPGFRATFLKTIYLHADFTERHIERSDVNGNHFTADAAALVFAGAFFGEGAGPKRWLKSGLAELEREVVLQVTPDGVDFEASVPYHRLNVELFGLPAIYARAVGASVSATWTERMRAMARFTAAYMRSDGTSPVWGDADNARALPMAQVQGVFADHRYLLALVGHYFNDDALTARFGGPLGEVYWLCGPAVAESLRTNTPPPRKDESFAEGGFFVLAGDDDHVFVDCGPVGLGGRGGHGHNDILSFEAALAGQVLVVDSGCNAYTGSVVDRNAFRSTDYHNTPRIDGEEINRFFGPLDLWTLQYDAKPILLGEEHGAERSTLTVSHGGYKRLSAPVQPIRRVTLDHAGHSLIVEDRFEGSGAHRVEIPLHFHPDVTATAAGDKRLNLATPRGRFCLDWSSASEWSMTLEPSRYAPNFGVCVPSTRAVFRREGALPEPLIVTIKPMAAQ